MRPHEIVIDEMGISTAHAIDLFELPRGQFLIGVKTPASLKESLAAQDLMYTRDAAVKMMRRIKQGSVRIGNLRRESQKFRRRSAASGREMFDRLLSPHSPMAEQSSNDARANGPEGILGHEVDKDAVVVSGI